MIQQFISLHQYLARSKNVSRNMDMYVQCKFPTLNLDSEVCQHLI